MLARPVVHAASFGIDHQHPGILADQPDRRSRCGRAENNLEALRGAQFYVFLQPVKIVFALLRLHERPRELAHVNKLKAELFYIAYVARPLVRRPSLRIIIDANPGQVGLVEIRILRYRRQNSHQQPRRHHRCDYRSFHILHL